MRHDAKRHVTRPVPGRSWPYPISLCSKAHAIEWPKFRFNPFIMNYMRSVGHVLGNHLPDQGNFLLIAVLGLRTTPQGEECLVGLGLWVAPSHVEFLSTE